MVRPSLLMSEGVPKTAVIGNRRSHVYHKPTCRRATVMSEKNRVKFESAQQVEAAGYRRAGQLRASGWPGLPPLGVSIR